MGWKESGLWKTQYQQIICSENNFNRIHTFIIFTIVFLLISSLLNRGAAAFNDLKIGLNAKDAQNQRSPPPPCPLPRFQRGLEQVI